MLKIARALIIKHTLELLYNISQKKSRTYVKNIVILGKKSIKNLILHTIILDV